MEMRLLGRTGERVSAFGFGGIVVKGMAQAEANNIVAEAVDARINYFDVAPTYGDSQQKLGPALKPYRSKVLLTCKTDLRDAAGARRQLEESLRLLETDHFDVYQLHGIDDPDEIEQAMAPGGAMEVLLDAKHKGLARFIGFTCHKQESALKLLKMFDFDTVLFPFNWTYWLAKGVGQELIDAALQRNMGIIAMKALAHRNWLKGEERCYPNCWYKPIFDDKKLASMALRFTLSHPISVALSPGDPRMLRLGISILGKLENAGAISDEEIGELTRLANENDQFMW
jgi:predicted aldo/keto reductase-like oxidoreductase